MGYIVLFVFMVLIDQISKLWALRFLSDILTLPIWEGVFHLTYVQNSGAAFGIFQQSKWFLLLVTFGVLALIGWYLWKKRPTHRLFLYSITSICAGAVGNLIDRIRLSYVVDFLDVRLISFPVFNIADCFVVVGVFVLIFLVLTGKVEL